MIETNFIAKLYETQIIEQLNNQSHIEKMMEATENQKKAIIMQNLTSFEKLLVKIKLFRKMVYKQFEFHETPTDIFVYKKGKPNGLIKKTTSCIEIKMYEMEK